MRSWGAFWAIFVLLFFSDVTVQLPWVSRSALDAAARERDAAMVREATLTAKYDALLAEHLAYLRPPVAVARAKAAPFPQERDPLMALAAERGGRDAGLRRHLMAYVAKERAAGVDDETIANRVTQWDDPEDEQ